MSYCVKYDKEKLQSSCMWTNNAHNGERQRQHQISTSNRVCHHKKPADIVTVSINASICINDEQKTDRNSGKIWSIT